MRKRILVLMGGISSEHDVSVVSGSGVVRALEPKRYNVHPVLITKEGEWLWSSRELTPYQKQNFFAQPYFTDLAGSTSARREKSPALSELPDCDIAFLALHGKFGEDGRVQALLENWGIPYTGSGVLASALAMDKIQSKAVYLANGIPTPDYVVLRRKGFQDDQLLAAIDKLGLPLVVKDPCGGSSIDMGIAKTIEEAKSLVETLFQKVSRLLCEKFIPGDEASCGYIEDQPAVPPTEIRMTKTEFFDYQAKYQGDSREVTPAEFPADRIAQIQALACAAHEALGCAVYSRTDVRIDQDGNLFALETNTLPGMTPTSLLPQQAACIGVDYSHLLDIVIETSLRAEQ
ncbi:MAG TPA: D-alanine--D-alanine ligase [Fibrobacteraceae bacterium]|nr:D-alanine--D-alanine ligase [Fibrobacteraceae bacterium]